MAHERQWLRPDTTEFPQVRQTLPGSGISSFRGLGRLPLASRRRRWVNRVGRASSLPEFRRLDQSSEAIRSAYGATSLPHVGAVSDSFFASSDTNLQFPVVVSRNQQRRNGSRVIQSNSQASTAGRTA